MFSGDKNKEKSNREWSQSIAPLEKQCLFRLSKNSPYFILPEVSLPCSRDNVIVPSVGHMDPVHSIQFYRFKVSFTVIIPYKHGIASVLFPEGFPVTKLYAT
jgi:hypothetical protein